MIEDIISQMNREANEYFDTLSEEDKKDFFESRMADFEN